MRLNIIHNPAREDRRFKLDKELSEQGITDFKICPAIIDTQFPFRGIARAHKLIVLNAKINKQEMVCIAEDDVKFTSDRSWEYFNSCIPCYFDIYLGGCYQETIDMDGNVIDFCGLHLYIVHERFYDTFLGLNEMTNIDRQLGKLGKCVLCDPMVAVQYDGFSEHKRRVCSYGHLVKGKNILI